MFYLAWSSYILYNDSIWLLLFDFYPNYFYICWNLLSYARIYFYDNCNFIVSYDKDFYNFYMDFLYFYYSCLDCVNCVYNYWIRFLFYFILSVDCVNFAYKFLMFLLLIYKLSAFYLILVYNIFLLFFC